jgi:hypothetical protein
MFLKCSSKSGPAIPLHEIVLVIHTRNMMDVLLESGRVATIRKTLGAARKVFQKYNINYFEPATNIIVIRKYILNISKSRMLMLDEEVLAAAPVDFRKEIENLQVSRKRCKEFQSSVNGNTAAFRLQNLSHTAAGMLTILYIYVKKR